MKKYPLSLSPDYCADWTPEDAIRELLANSLDDTSKFQYSYDGDELRITSVGVQIPPSTLLLGNTTKRDDSDSVGMFGEGYKIAMLILCREGFGITVLNGKKLWQPVYEYCDLFESDALVIHEDDLSGNDDLTFVVNGVTKDLMKTVSDRCIYLQDDIGDTLDTSRGRILLDKKGLLFVGGIYVQHTDLDYSYDFNPDCMPLNRDRKSVDDWDLKTATSLMWSESKDPSEVAELVYRKVPDVRLLKYGENSKVADACADLYAEKHAGEYLAEDYMEQSRMTDLGAKNVVVLGNDAFSAIVRKSSKYQEPELEEAPEELSPTEMMAELIEGIDNSISSDNEMANIMLDDISDLYDLFIDKGVEWR
jgi:hypothetical protein